MILIVMMHVKRPEVKRVTGIRKKPIGQRLITVIPLAALVLAGVAGCSSERKVVLPQPHITQSFPALSATQLEKVVNSLAHTIDAGDKALDAHMLTGRVENPALELREAQYSLAKKKGENTHVTLMPLRHGTMTLTASRTWPRYVVNVASKDIKSPTYVQVLRQDTARSPFKLWQWVRLFPHTTFPPTAVIQKGTSVVGAQSSAFQHSPQEALKRYTDSLLDPSALKKAGFASDTLATLLQKEQSSYQSKFAHTYNYSQKLEPTKNIAGIMLEDKSALVAAQINQDITITQQDSQGSLTLSGDIATLLGNNGKVQKGAKITQKIMLLMIIPPHGSHKKMRVIGAERVLMSAQAQ